MELTKNFKLKEFNCKDGTPVPQKHIWRVAKLAENLQVLRDILNTPIVIRSGYRTIKHNRAVGGKAHSFHLLGMAADIYTEIYTPMQIANIIEELIDKELMDEGGIGIYSTFVHYDIRGYRARW